MLNFTSISDCHFIYFQAASWMEAVYSILFFSSLDPFKRSNKVIVCDTEPHRGVCLLDWSL